MKLKYYKIAIKHANLENWHRKCNPNPVWETIEFHIEMRAHFFKLFMEAN